MAERPTTGPSPVASAAGPARVWLLTAAVAAVAVVLGPGASASPAAVLAAWPWVLGLGALFLVAELSRIVVHFGPQAEAWSLSEIPLIVGLALVDPVVLVVGRLLGSLVVFLVRRQPPVKIAFNTALVWLETAFAIVLWRVLLDGGEALSVRGWAAVLAVIVAVELLASMVLGAAMRLVGAPRPTREGRHILTLGSIRAVTNASFGLLVLFVATVDWRGLWTVGVITVVLFLGYEAHNTLRRRHESLERITGFTEKVGRELDVDAVADAVLTNLRIKLEVEVAELDITGVDEGASVLLTHDGDGVRRAAGGRGLATALLDGGTPRPLVLPKNGRRADDRRRLTATSLRDAMVVPIAPDGRIIGTLVVADRTSDVGTFDRNDLRVFETMANHAGVALAKAGLADRLRHQARHDPLTGLLNRAALLDRLRDQLAGGDAAVLLLDLDRFKEVNDTLGHRVGDELLVEVGSRLVATVEDAACVARLGGDEFAILLRHHETVEQQAAELVQALRQPFRLQGVTVAVDASVGIAVGPQDGSEGDELLQHADVAMYLAKQSHRGVERYHPDRDPYSPERLGLVAELRSAIETGALGVHFQPKVDVRTGIVRGAEALVRWDHPQRGAIGPDEFIPVAEQTGLIEPLTDHVLRQATAQCRAWQDRGLDLHVAVNISPRSLTHPDFVARVQDALWEAHLPPHHLTLEITESVLVSEAAHAALHRLRDAGVRLAIDDLGTGYSSLAYLKRLPVDEVKIDRSFVQTLGRDAADEAIVTAIIELAHHLDKTVVAEGVEDRLGWSRLQALGCDLAQGYFLSRPLAPAAFDAWEAGQQARGRRPA